MQRSLRLRASVGVALVGAGIVAGASLVAPGAQSPATENVNAEVELTAGPGDLFDFAPLAAAVLDNPQDVVVNPQDVVVNPQDVVVPDCVVVDCVVSPPVVVDPLGVLFNDILAFFNTIVNEIDSLFGDALGFLP